MNGRIAVVLGLAVCLAFGQALRERILLPDSLGVTQGFARAVCDTVHNKTYFAGQGAVGVLSGPEGRRTGRIDIAGNACSSTRDAVYWDAPRGRIYDIADKDTIIWVIDTETDSVVSSITLPAPLYALGPRDFCCYAPDLRKLYVQTNGGCAVIDTRADTLLYIIQMPHSCGAPGMVYDSSLRKFCVILENNVAIFDAVADTLLTMFRGGNGQSDIGLIQSCDRVYVSCITGQVAIVDLAGDSLIRIATVPGSVARMTINEDNRKVYISSGWECFVYDGQGDTLLRHLTDCSGKGVWNPLNGRMYLLAPAGIHILDGATDSLIDTIPWSTLTSPARCTFNPVENTFYIGTPLFSRLDYVDCNGDSILWSEYIGRETNHLVWSPANRLLYGLDQCSTSIMEIPVASTLPPRTFALPCSLRTYLRGLAVDTVQGKLYAGERYCVWLYVLDIGSGVMLDSILLPSTLRYSQAFPEHNRLHCAVWDPETICIIDTRTDSIVATVPGGADMSVHESACAYSETQQKAYWAGSDEVVVIDVTGDSILTLIDIPHPLGVCWQSAADRVYVATASSGVKVVDCRTDEVVDVVGTQQLNSMTYSATEDKLYCMRTNGDLEIIDCSTNAVVGYLFATSGLSHVTPVWNPRGNKVWFAALREWTANTADHVMRGVDCVTDRIVASVDIDYKPCDIALDPDSGLVMVSCANSAIYVITDTTPTGIEEPSSPVEPERLVLEAMPNPTVGSVLINLQMPGRSYVELGVYDTSGRLVRQLLTDEVGPARVQLMWDGTDGTQQIPAGTYIVRESITGETCKVVLTR